MCQSALVKQETRLLVTSLHCLDTGPDIRSHSRSIRCMREQFSCCDCTVCSSHQDLTEAWHAHASHVLLKDACICHTTDVHHKKGALQNAFSKNKNKNDCQIEPKATKFVFRQPSSDSDDDLGRTKIFTIEMVLQPMMGPDGWGNDRPERETRCVALRSDRPSRLSCFSQMATRENDMIDVAAL
jgi:hypothetical protein